MVSSMAPAVTANGRRRKTQTERRAETRAALLDATIKCLITYGYAKTTTGRIAELAGVSRGAQLPYFRSRADIVSAAVAHLAEKRISAFKARFLDRPVSLEECLDALWKEHQGPIFDAALELWVASRTDSDLRAHLVEIERDVAAAIAEAAESALGDLARRPAFTEDLFYAMATIRGFALLQISNGVSSRTMTRRWLQTRERLLQVLR
jgi:AcrR family transcriptional regulator